MKKIRYFAMILIAAALLAGCQKAAPADNDMEPKDTPAITAEPAPEPTQKPTAVPTEEPAPAPGEIVTDHAAISGMAQEILDGMTLEQKIGQMFILNFEQLDNSQGNYYEFRSISDGMKANLDTYGVGGVVFFARNIETREQTALFIEELDKASHVPLFFSVDEEGGDVARIANNDNMQTTKFPSMEEVGKMDDEEYAYNMGTTIGSEIKELGFNLDFAPVADVRTNESNTEIGNRSFGDNAKLVARMVKQVVKGLQDQGISATLKHFPGHGDAKEDSHKGAVNIDNDLNRLRTVDFVPFKAGIKAGVDFIMVSHISISRVTENTVPASMSPLVMETMLREEMGFNGIVITDAMNMKSITDDYQSGEAAVLSIQAGADMLLMPYDFIEAYNAVMDAVSEGTIEEARIDRSVRLILEKKIERGLILSDTDLILR